VQLYDRVAVGDQLMMLRWPGKEEEEGGATAMMTDEDCVSELQEGLVSNREAGGAGASAGNAAAAAELDEERRKILVEREKWEKEKTDMQSQRNEEEYRRAMASVDNAILDLLPKAKEAKQTVDLLNRVTMTFDVVLEKGQDHIPRVKWRTPTPSCPS
jgi:hypothetical protein